MRTPEKQCICLTSASCRRDKNEQFLHALKHLQDADGMANSADLDHALRL